VDLLYFVLLVSSLIFIHESGHFAFAKIFGVKVITFSIGFGPKVVRIRGKETEYCIGLLPFGGFVKMLEESKSSEPILPEERKRTFEAQALWKRVAIVLAGPAMNLLFPIALYTSVFLEDKEFLPPTVGAVVPDKPAEGVGAGFAARGQARAGRPHPQRRRGRSDELPRSPGDHLAARREAREDGDHAGRPSRRRHGDARGRS
jgi:membrane-associated protease RseP (regulator of RpoE activity)